MTLELHKNTKKQALSKSLREGIVKEAQDLAELEDISGYAIIVWNDDFSADCGWHCTGLKMPTSVMPEFFKQTFIRCLNDIDTNDTINCRFF